MIKRRDKGEERRDQDGCGRKKYVKMESGQLCINKFVLSLSGQALQLVTAVCLVFLLNYS